MYPKLKCPHSKNLNETSKQQKQHDGTTDTNYQKRVTTMNSFDSLTPTLIALYEKCTTLSEQMIRLQKADESILRFNDSFGAFLFGLSANSTVAQWPDQPSTEMNIDQYIPIQENNSVSLDTTSNPSSPQANRPPIAKPLKFVSGKIDIENTIDRLPLKYREQSEYRKAMKTVLLALGRTPEGMNMNSVVDCTKLPKHRVTDCLSAVIRIKEVIKFNPKGKLAVYRLNPTKYPSI